MKRKTALRQRRGKKILLTMLLLPATILVGWLLLATAASESATDAARNLVESSVHRRGNIYDRHFEPLAVSFRLGSIYARPLEIDHPEATAATLAAILPVSQKELLNSLRAERSFIWLARRADEETMERVAARNLAGVHIMPRSHRFYPQQRLAAHAVGFVREDQGLAGLELAHDDLLQNGRAGRHLLSTLDLSIQRALQERLERARRTVDGRLAGGLVMDVESGAVAAMVSLPAYDPNNFWAHDSHQRVNQLVVPRLRLAVLEKLLPELATARPELARQLGLCQPPERGLPAAQQAMALDLAAPHGGLSKPAEVDCQRLLADPEARFSGLTLVTAFSRLAGGGAAVEPHLDGQSWDGVKARRLPAAQPGSGGEAIDLDNWRQLLATADAGQGEAAPVVVESLVRQRQSVDEVEAVVARAGEGGQGGKADASGGRGRDTAALPERNAGSGSPTGSYPGAAALYRPGPAGSGYAFAPGRCGPAVERLEP
ncbi:MAG: hypothetical protein U5J62_07510 [Desulfurivibrio sp.]|nr:hypothetical protein [Desulfurivibrio sp.]